MVIVMVILIELVDLIKLLNLIMSVKLYKPVELIIRTVDMLRLELEELLGDHSVSLITASLMGQLLKWGEVVKARRSRDQSELEDARDRPRCHL